MKPAAAPASQLDAPSTAESFFAVSGPQRTPKHKITNDEFVAKSGVAPWTTTERPASSPAPPSCHVCYPRRCCRSRAHSEAANSSSSIAKVSYMHPRACHRSEHSSLLCRCSRHPACQRDHGDHSACTDKLAAHREALLVMPRLLRKQANVRSARVMPQMQRGRRAAWRARGRRGRCRARVLPSQNNIREQQQRARRRMGEARLCS